MSSEVVNVKLRIFNNIHKVKMSPSGVTEVLLEGLNSTIVKTIKNSRADSVVTGHFESPVEILSAINQSDVSKPGAKPTEEVMEIEVSSSYFVDYNIFVQMFVNTKTLVYIDYFYQITAPAPGDDGKNVNFNQLT